MTEDFLAESIEQQIIRICEGLDVDPPEGFIGPSASDSRPPDEPWRSFG